MKSYSPKYIIDLHQDLLLHINHKHQYPDPAHIQTSVEMLKRNDVKVVFATGFPSLDDHNHFDISVNKWITNDILEYQKLCQTDKDFRIIKTKKDLEEVMAGETLYGIVFAVEGLNAIDKSNFQFLDTWFDLGMRSLGIVWNLQNKLGSGADAEGGLTDLGRETLLWAEHNHVVIDLSHMNEETFADTLDATRCPIAVTHGNARALNSRPRNYSDEQIKKVADRDGIIGTFFATNFITTEKPVTINHVADQIDYLMQIAGVDHVAIGSDLGGILSAPIPELSCVDDFPNVWNVLNSRGYSDETIDKIAYQNALQFMRRVFW